MLHKPAVASAVAAATTATGVWQLAGQLQIILAIVASVLGICLTIVLLVLHGLTLRDKLRNEGNK